MASSDTLREQVATDLAAIISGEPDWGVPAEPDETWQLADAAIRVVLAAVTEQIEALGTDWTIIRAGEARYEPGKASDFKREALNAVARLGGEDRG